jgi:hypothetical protein
MRFRLRAYLAAFILAAAVVGLSYRGADRWWNSLGCFARPPAGQFLAYCGAPQFGDYEHGAYYFNLEQAAIARLKQSDVVFFGTSRAQLALSTRAWSDFFRARGMSAYLAGFGFNEAGAFPLALIRKYDLKPKAVVVLADPFFRNRSSAHIRVTQPLRWRIVPEMYESVQKKLFIAAGARFCDMRPAACVTTKPIVYRSRDDGAWHPSNFDLAAKFVVSEQGASGNFTAAMAVADVDFAERFIAATGVGKPCVVLSVAPSASVNSDGYVAEMGKLLGVRVVLPKLADLTTFDGSHLTPESAERWSAALLSEIGETLSRCTRR